MTAGAYPDNKPGLSKEKSQPPHQPERIVPVVANCIDTRDLFTGTREVTITHGGYLYRLRLTSQNKLLLTK